VLSVEGEKGGEEKESHAKTRRRKEGKRESKREKKERKGGKRRCGYVCAVECLPPSNKFAARIGKSLRDYGRGVPIPFAFTVNVRFRTTWGFSVEHSLIGIPFLSLRRRLTNSRREFIRRQPGGTRRFPLSFLPFSPFLLLFAPLRLCVRLLSLLSPFSLNTQHLTLNTSPFPYLCVLCVLLPLRELCVRIPPPASPAARSGGARGRDSRPCGTRYAGRRSALLLRAWADRRRRGYRCGGSRGRR
jgi:hypothetical protein